MYDRLNYVNNHEVRLATVQSQLTLWMFTTNTDRLVATNRSTKLKTNMTIYGVADYLQKKRKVLATRLRITQK